MLNKLRMGEYYENMFHLNTERIAVLEALVQNKDAEIAELISLVETKDDNILILKKEIKVREERYKGREKEFFQQKVKTVVIVAVITVAVTTLVVVSAM